MNTYLTIMVTVLVVTQIVRITQNFVQLRRQRVLYEKDLEQLADNITEKDIKLRRKNDELLAELLPELQKYIKTTGENND